MNHTNQMFNLMKLPEYVPLFQNKKVAVAGVGAVGSHLVHILAMMGVGEIWCFDFDAFESDNLAKCSAMIDPETDVGHSKAQVVATQAGKRMIPGGKCYGIHGDLRNYGPMALAGFDAIFIALDNYAAKVLENQNFLQIPISQRPVIGMAGTNKESAVAVLADGKEFCMRCLFDEEWLENSDVRTSCSGPQYMQIDGVSEGIRTSGLASIFAAAILAEKFRAWVLGAPNVMNTRTTYTPYPNLELLDTVPMSKRSCPDCHSFCPPQSIRLLSGSVWDLTLDQALSQIADVLGTEDFELQTHLMHFKELSYGGFITDEYCHHCGKPVSVYAHESRIHFEDVLCEDCIATDNSAYYNTERSVGESLRCFAPTMEDDRLRSMTLYELGYPIGAYLYVVRHDPGADSQQYCFCCMADQSIMKKITEI